MEIEGPLKIGVLESQDAAGYELHVSFPGGLRALPAAERTRVLRDCLQDLGRMIHVGDGGDAERQGVLLLQQLTEQRLPHVEAGEVDLEQTLVVEIQPDSPLSRFIPGDASRN